MNSRALRIGVLASHEGTLLQYVIDACRQERLAASIAVVISNNSSSGALRRARETGIPTAHLSSQTHPELDTLDRAITNTLEQAGVNLVLLVGYMKPLGRQSLERFNHRIVNTHPALLPKYGGAGFYGRRVHEAVLASGDAESGATVHWVVGEYDSGPIISQSRVPVLANDTVEALEERVKQAERELLIDTLIELSLSISDPD